MPRTTLNLDASILAALRKRAVADRRSLGEVASLLLARALGEDPARAEPSRLEWNTSDGGSSVDLNDPLVLKRWAYDDDDPDA